jgi:hypothetical protein
MIAQVDGDFYEVHHRNGLVDKLGRRIKVIIVILFLLTLLFVWVMQNIFGVQILWPM